MPAVQPGFSLSPRDLARGWWGVLNGRVPMMSIEITRECPLRYPGCYAYGDSHLGGETTLRELSDRRGDSLVEGVLDLVRRHKPMHVSLVGGEPMVRHRELSRILPALSKMDLFTMVVTSGVIAIPQEWMAIFRLRVAVSVDGLPEHHDERRKPATYERILKNVVGLSMNVHWVITRPMLSRPSYLQEYVAFWNARPEVDHIWVSLYSPQMGEDSPERLSAEHRDRVARELPRLRLQPVRLQHLERAALDSRREDYRASESRPSGKEFAGHRLGGAPSARGCRRDRPLEERRPICGREASAGSDRITGKSETIQEI
jgi:MoaA/NifB/PqqE/SkfB family radical SAM enzyme